MGSDSWRRRLAESFPLGFDKTYAPFVWDQLVQYTEIWVACFSELRDDLNQWRSYGRAGDDRYCIGFDPSLIKVEIESHHFTSPQWLQVLYTKPDKIAAIRRICREERIRRSKSKPTKGSARFDLKLFMALPAFKDESFSPEREWRFVIYQRPRYRRYEDGTPVQFKCSGGHLTPYLTMTPESGKLPITEVLFLPRRGGAVQCETAAEFLLEGRGYLSEVVRRSSIPFVD